VGILNGGAATYAILLCVALAGCSASSANHAAAASSTSPDEWETGKPVRGHPGEVMLSDGEVVPLPPDDGAGPNPKASPETSNYDTYSVRDVEKAGTPRLDAKQSAWLRLIHADPAYFRIWNRLRWTLVAVHDQRTPVIVFDFDPNYYTNGPYSLEYDEFRIIGESCNTAFDPSERDVVALSHFDRPCEPSEQPAVRGQKALLGWEP
jgi:hypothetical protein